MRKVFKDIRVDKTNGDIILDQGDFVISESLTLDIIAERLPNTTFYQFSKDHPFVNLGEILYKNSIPISIQLGFQNKVLFSISFNPIVSVSSPEGIWSEEANEKEKTICDELIQELLGEPPYHYDWGHALSAEDRKGGGVSVYITTRAAEIYWKQKNEEYQKTLERRRNRRLDNNL
jgi:hypothetical protein